MLRTVFSYFRQRSGNEEYMNINVDALMNSLPIMGKGMLGIFVVTLVIILSITLLNALTSEKKQSEDSAQ